MHFPDKGTVACTEFSLLKITSVYSWVITVCCALCKQLTALSTFDQSEWDYSLNICQSKCSHQLSIREIGNVLNWFGVMQEPLWSDLSVNKWPMTQLPSFKWSLQGAPLAQILSHMFICCPSKHATLTIFTNSLTFIVTDYHYIYKVLSKNICRLVRKNVASKVIQEQRASMYNLHIECTDTLCIMCVVYIIFMM